MAQLKNTIVTGNLQVTEKTISGVIKTPKVEAPTTSGGTSYGAGTSGQVLTTNGTSVYWGSLPEGVSPSSTTPKMDGTATVGTETAFARGDHVHPVDDSRAPIEDPHFIGVPTAETAASGTWTTQIATTGFVCGEIKNEVHDNAGVANGYATLDSDVKVVASQTAKKTVTVTSSRSLQLSDAGKYLIVNSSGYVDISIPAFNVASFPTDTEIIVCNYGTGIVTFIVPNTVTMHSADGILQMPKQYCVAHLKNIGINSWVLSYEYQDMSSYAKNASPAFTGTPTAPTAAAGTNTTQLATTAFVKTAVDNKSVPSATTTTPKMDGTAAVGSETTWAKGDHVHPTDTSRAPLASPALTGTPTAPTATAGTSSTQIATTAFVGTAIANAKPTTTTATVATSAWSNLSATVNVTGVTASNTVIVAPAPASREVAVKAQMYCSAQGAGTLTFACKTVPTANVTVNVMIFG